MEIETLLKEGRLSDALANLKKQVAAKPSDASLRWFLFQLFSFTGDWKRAQDQITLAAQLDKNFQSRSMVYSRVLSAERLRADIVKGTRTPVLLGEPEPWLAQQFEANRLLGEGKIDEATELRMKVFEEMPASSGKLNGIGFEWICDQDSRFGATIECFMLGKYYWVPISQIKGLVIEQTPQSYTDILYPQAKMVLANEGVMDVMLFARYPYIEGTTDDAISMNRLTVWESENDYTLIGSGQRLLCTNESDFPLLELTTLELD
ncbi:MAG: type VI secretion system accessory protein TagJ [Opitutaceae bacterium]